MSGQKAARCRHCKAPITWAENERNGHRIPLDVMASDDGWIVSTGERTWDGMPIVRVHANRETAMASNLEARRFTNHLSTCKER